ncbi:hypothetical protein C9374_008259 [Naegleria lovaniensis]|uniref:Uncharacterized protein n=1 Tax=Naegleria lovaniensis TaxID=51637 RepID=A0AA88GKV6_NAELO|nr:uncharacterized protein C9374_008259 [Naegleria lovaniensis]KAG2378620.1 hypothetical protein C9374_008259 [Naegleria lovaniensis]
MKNPTIPFSFHRDASRARNEDMIRFMLMMISLTFLVFSSFLNCMQAFGMMNNMLSSDTNPSFYCKVHTSNIRLTFTSPYVAKLCDGDAYCFSGTTKTLTATFSLNPFYDDLSYNKYIRSVGTMGAQISGAFNPCYAYGANLNFTSLTSLHVNGQPILLQRKNLGQDIVSTTCADKGSCSKTFSAAASMLEAGFSTDLNITQQGNEVTFEFEGTSSPTTYLCVKQLELRLCSIPKTTTVVSYTAQITSTTPSVLNFVTNDTVWALQNEPFPNSKELLKSYSDQFVRRVKITNPALAFSPEFSLIINPSMYQFMPSMTIDVVSVNKTFTDPVTNQVLTINISESVTLKRSSSRYELTFNTSLWKDDEISLDIRISLVSPYSNSGFGYFSYDVSPLDTSKNAYYNTRPYGAVQDQFSYTSRQIFNINYNTPQKITALGKLSDVVAVNYSPDPNTPSMDGQMPLCYMQINTIFPDNVFEFSGTIYFYSTKTNKQYSANFGPSYTIDPNKKQAQYFISSEMLDCTQGSSTMIYVWLEILTIDKYYESGVITTQVSASRKSIQLIDDANKVYTDLSFSSKYDGTVYYVKSFSSLKFPYDLTVSTTYSSLNAPFLSFLSYNVPLSWADQKPMILQSTKAPSSSTDFAAYDVDVAVGMFFTFIEKGVCSIYPCRASFKFSVSQDLVNPPTLSTTPSNTLTITKSGYRSNGFLTAVEIPQINSVVTRNAQATQSNVLYNLKVIAAVKVDSQPRLFTITRPLALQVSKQYDTLKTHPLILPILNK